MKKNKAIVLKVVMLLMACMTAILCQAAHNYASQSVLRQGKWTKIKVRENGLYKLTYEQIQQMGHDPATVRIFGYGGAMLNELFTEPYTDDLPEVATYVYTGDDNTFGPGDYIIFYGQGPISWRYNRVDNYAQPLFIHTTNYYSTYGCYFVTSGGTASHIVPSTSETATSAETIRSFTDYMVHELDSINFISSGREFFGEEINSSKMRRSLSFSVPNMLSEMATMRFSAAARGTAPTVLTVQQNNDNIGSLSISARNTSASYEFARVNSEVWNFTPNMGNVLPITVASNNSSSTAWINFVEVNLPRMLQITGDRPLYFRDITHLGQGETHTFEINGANANTKVWDITHPEQAFEIPATFSNGKLSFAALTDTIREFVALDPSHILLQPEVGTSVANQNLHALPATDYVIIAHNEFLHEAERLADAHRLEMSVEVVDAEAVYNEFSSGTPDGTAYRRFMKMFYDRGQAPKYLLLFGDGSYDNRNLLPRATEVNVRRLLTFQSLNSVYEGVSYVSDDYFTFLDDNEGLMDPSQTMDIAVGRFPVNTLEQAKTAVDKTIYYMNNTPNRWHNQILFLADDGDYNEHILSADSVARQTERLNPDMLVRKIYFDAYKQVVSATGERYPEVEALFDNYIKQGTLVTNYMGHGGYTGWSNEAVLNTEKIVNMYNEHYPLYVTATCDFSGYDNFKASAGELLFRNEHGGTMALFTTTRAVYSNPNLVLNLHTMRHLFELDSNGLPRRLGDVVRMAKNQQTNSTNKFSFTLLGDPALRLTYPYEYKVRTDSINHLAIASDMVADTISALSEVTLHGSIIRATDSVKANGFNGTVFINVYDKEETITTLCNDANSKPFNFQYRSNPIFSGSVMVENGEFSVTFMVPKDIRYNYGTGRIVYFAQNDDNTMEANGSFEQFIVGGENPNAPVDNEGPEVQLYLNDPSFHNGEAVANTPLFVAKVFDQSGINTLGSGIGHDMILRINGETANEIVLNSFYTSDLGSYQSGTVCYELPSLPDGIHKLMFRVWDLQNNSTTDSLTFTIDSSLKPRLTNLEAYPNPLHQGETLNIVYTHDRPQAPLNVTASLHTPSGQLVMRESRQIITDNNNRFTLAWNLANTFSEGLYILRMRIEDENGLFAQKAVKVILIK